MVSKPQDDWPMNKSDCTSQSFVLYYQTLCVHHSEGLGMRLSKDHAIEAE